MAAHVPLVSFAAARYIQRWLGPRARVFEYGGGGSTLWLAERVGSLVTVEHNAEWLNMMRAELDHAQIKTVDLLSRPPDLIRPAGPEYRSPVEPGNFEHYVRSIDTYPDDSFDVVIVDGRCRTSCVAHAAPKVRPGGLLVLDDANRPRYQVAVRLLGQWQRHDFWGLRPAKPWTSFTTAWVKPAAGRSQPAP